MKPPPVKTPPLWLSLALILWGVSTGPWLIALFMALTLELPLMTRWQWNIDDKEFHRVGDLSSVIFALVAIFQFNQYAMHGIYQILALLPFCLFPLRVERPPPP